MTLSASQSVNWKEALKSKLSELQEGLVELNCMDLPLGCKELSYISSAAENANLKITLIKSHHLETLVSAAALGHQTQLNLSTKQDTFESLKNETENFNSSTNTMFHEGTLRSGEHLESEGDVLVLGDVNPGATITAKGNVLIWGRLLGTAHAGKGGNDFAKIVALQLRPLQLRISNAIARGPAEKPEPGLAEEAYLQSGQILIKPAGATR
ncbi:septum site-determining protein MinC [Prochlorococcus sp. MIT 1300]|uniref:septum site-determining protein MinC n=1 Tax=Prochlorococcus sp. MIT 1300 TaxID=3096218 RepID=UPI002A756D18|nr:septum site-determining protein MinC [Prochlorococcus sp. MIT 1300]